jgi:hypothetical protein
MTPLSWRSLTVRKTVARPTAGTAAQSSSTVKAPPATTIFMEHLREIRVLLACANTIALSVGTPTSAG